MQADVEVAVAGPDALLVKDISAERIVVRASGNAGLLAQGQTKLPDTVGA
jgi:hypothetical protein